MRHSRYIPVDSVNLKGSVRQFQDPCTHWRRAVWPPLNKTCKFLPITRFRSQPGRIRVMNFAQIHLLDCTGTAMALQMKALNHSARCQKFLFLSSPSRQVRLRCHKKPLRCVAQAVAAPATGTYSGKEISKPLIGDHFLHIDDYSKDVKSCHARQRPCTSTDRDAV
jgi:hypothetical protein